MTATGTPALSLAYFRDGAVVWTRAWGVADAETREPVTDRTLFQAASISKPVSAVAVLKAVERGLIQLDRPVNEQLRGWHLPDNELTQQAAGDAATPPQPRRRHHRARVPRLRADRDAAERARHPRRHRWRQHRRGARRSRAAPQGALLGGGTTILQPPLTEVAAQPSPTCSRSGSAAGRMTDSAFDQPPPPIARRTPLAHTWRRARPLRRDGTSTRSSPPPGCGPRRATSHCSRSRSGGRGAVRATGCSTAESAKLMTTPAGIGSFALGFEMQDRGNDTAGEIWYFSHSGGNFGFRSLLVVDREQGHGFAATINGSDFNPLLEVQRRIALAYEWKGDFTKPPAQLADRSLTRSAAQPEPPTIRPSPIATVRSASAAASSRSCVTRIDVSFGALRSRATSARSATRSSGSRFENGSSSRRNRGVRPAHGPARRAAARRRTAGEGIGPLMLDPNEFSETSRFSASIGRAPLLRPRARSPDSPAPSGAATAPGPETRTRCRADVAGRGSGRGPPPDVPSRRISPVVRHLEARDQPQQRRLPAAARAEDHDGFARPRLRATVVQGRV